MLPSYAYLTVPDTTASSRSVVPDAVAMACLVEVLCHLSFEVTVV